MKIGAVVVIVIWLALMVGAGAWVFDRMPPFPTCAGLGGGCGSR